MIIRNVREKKGWGSTYSMKYKLQLAMFPTRFGARPLYNAPRPSFVTTPRAIIQLAPSRGVL